MSMSFLLEGSHWPLPARKDSIDGQSGVYGRKKSSLTDLIPERLSDCGQSQSKPLEFDPNGLSAKAPGSKLDAGKVDVIRGAVRYFPEALKAVARVSELGAQKYSWMGWRTVPDGVNRYSAALGRHLLYPVDSTDSGLGGLGDNVLHAAQVAWNALAVLELVLEQRQGKNQCVS